MKDLISKSKALLKTVDALESEFEGNPFLAELVESQGQVTACQALLDETEKEPESLSPEEIVAARQQARNALEIATITHRRAKAKCDQFGELLSTKAEELRGDALAVITGAHQAYQNQVVAEVLAVGGGFFNESQVHGVPQGVARHRSQVLTQHKDTVDGRMYARQTDRELLKSIRAALQSVIDHLA